MTERKLAHIELITELKSIPGADKIEVAKILGWECVVKKGEFNVGDKVVYVETDSVMPELPEYEFLRSRNFRVKIIKLKGQVSMGLVLPCNQDLQIGKDMTDFLGITKYLSPSEQEEFNTQERKMTLEKNKIKKFMMRYDWFRKLVIPKKVGQWPYWVVKTDEERVQNLSWNKFYEEFKDKEVYVTEKIDYQSVTFTGKMIPRFNSSLGKLFPKKYQFVVCSRNMTTNNKNSLYWQIAKKYNIEQILRENPTLTIQGEQGSSKIQGNKYSIKEPAMWVFNIIDHERNYHYNYFEIKDFCDRYGLQVVPILYHKLESEAIIVNRVYCTLSELGSTVQELVEFSKGKSVLANIPREGIVVRCIENGKKILSFKVINPDFLLKYN